VNTNIKPVDNSLKPCPKCGSERANLVEHNGGYQVICYACDAQTRVCTSEFEARFRWTSKETMSRAERRRIPKDKKTARGSRRSRG